YLMLNVTYGISTLQKKHFATLLVGAGAGCLSPQQAVRGLLFGVCDALKRLPGGDRISKVSIVEIDYERCLEIHDLLKDIQSRDTTGVDIKIVPDQPKVQKRAGLSEAVKRQGQAGERSRFPPRITIERDGDVFRFSALTETAVIPVREVEIQPFFTDQIAGRLMFSTYRQEQERLGQLLTTTLIPEDFLSVFNQP